MRIQHILFPTDLSEMSMKPAASVGSLALREGAKLTLLHVMPVLEAIPYGAPLAPPVPERDREQRHEKALASLQELRDSLPADLEVESLVLDDSRTAEALSEYVDKHAVDLVALSTHGRSGLRRVAFGSVAESLIRKLHVPVLAFPPAP